MHRELNFDRLDQLVATKELRALQEELCTMNEVDVAEFLEQQEGDTQALVFRILPKDMAASVFSYFQNIEAQEQLINAFTDRELKDVLEELYLDDMVDIIEDMPASVVTRILRHSHPDTQETLHQLLHYPKDCAGTLMTTEFIHLRSHLRVAEAFDKIRQMGVDSETIYTCYVVEHRKLLGVVTLRQLLLAEENQTMAEMMETNLHYVHAHEDKEDVAQYFSKYDLGVVPVVDSERCMVGIITVDDIMDVLQEETTEDFEKMAAILPSDKPYLRTSVLATCGARIPWLMMLMLSATFTGLIITHFESALATTVVLASFIPMISGTGGNSGAQSSVAVIRAISLGEVQYKTTLVVIWKELRVATLCGLALATANFGKMMLIDHMLMQNPDVTPKVALVVCVTLMLTVICAKVVGCSLPILADKVGIDPAVMAAPFITTVVDALSLLIYFTMAVQILELNV